jgi:hypothetical protein
MESSALPSRLHRISDMLTSIERPLLPSGKTAMRSDRTLFSEAVRDIILPALDQASWEVERHGHAAAIDTRTGSNGEMQVRLHVAPGTEPWDDDHGRWLGFRPSSDGLAVRVTIATAHTSHDVGTVDLALLDEPTVLEAVAMLIEQFVEDLKMESQ